MKKWKQISVCCLAAAFTVSGPAATVWAGSPEFARTPEEWAKLRDNTMEYEELAGLIREYNVTVRNNQLDINDKKKDDLITSDENAQYYRDAASDYRSSITGDDPITDAQNAVEASSADAQADKNTEDLTVYQLTYHQEEANLVALAQSAMISYFSQQYEQESAKDSLKLSEAIYQSMLAKKEAGMATRTDVLSAREDVQNTRTSIDKLAASTEQARQTLCIMLGWKYNDMPEIREIPAMDMERLAAMDPKTDKEAALRNNYTLKTNKRKLENATADITKETLNRTISNNGQNISTDVVKNHHAVLQAKASYEQTAAEYELESKNMETAERKYQAGTLSRLDYLKQKNAYNTKRIAIKTAELALFQAAQAYYNAVDGLALAGG
ncbi:TolC family protein [Lachnospiraceae bacterium 54-53]